MASIRREQIRKFDPKIKIVFLTMHTELAYVQEAFDAGASGYVIKHSASIDLQLAIRRALSGTHIYNSGRCREPTSMLCFAALAVPGNLQRGSRRGSVRSCNFWLKDVRPRRLQQF